MYFLKRSVLLLVAKILLVIIVFYWLFVGDWGCKTVSKKLKGEWVRQYDNGSENLLLKSGGNFEKVEHPDGAASKNITGTWEESNVQVSDGKLHSLVLITHKKDTLLNSTIISITNKELVLKDVHTQQETSWLKK
jgi:hypothetical protein